MTQDSDYPFRVLIKKAINHYISEFQQYEKSKSKYPLSKDIVKPHIIKKYQQKFDQITKNLSTNTTTNTKQYINAIARNNNIDELSNSLESKNILLQFMREQQKITNTILERLSGNYIAKNDYLDSNEDIKSQKMIEENQSTREKSPKIKYLIEEYLQNEYESSPQKVKNHIRNAFNIVYALCGDDIRIDEITVKKANIIEDNIKYFPKNKSKSQYKNLTLKECFSMKLPPEVCITKASQNGYIGRIKGFFIWALRRGYIESNPVDHLRIKNAKAETKTTSGFNNDQLNIIFQQHNLLKYTGTKHGNFFIPLIASYTGARLQEIGQLSVNDIYYDNEAKSWAFRITDIEPEQRLKNKPSERKIPLHKHLVQLGIPNLVNYARSNQQKYIFFNDLKGENRGLYASQFFNKHLKTLNFSPDESGKRLVFHSFRATIENQLRQGNPGQELIDGYLGHQSPTVATQNYANKYRVIDFKKYILKHIQTNLVHLQDHFWVKKIKEYR